MQPGHELENLPAGSMMLEDELSQIVVEFPKEEPALKRRRSSDSLLSNSSDKMKLLIQEELHRALKDRVVPSILEEVESKFKYMHELNKDLISTANTVLTKVQLSFEELRNEQHVTKQQIHSEKSKASQQASLLEQMCYEQEKQHQALAQSQSEARFGFQVLENAVVNHEERLRNQTPDARIQSNYTVPSEQSAEYGQDDRGLGRQPVFDGQGSQRRQEVRTATVSENRPVGSNDTNLSWSRTPAISQQYSSNATTFLPTSPDMSFGMTIPSIPTNDPGNTRSWNHMNDDSAGANRNPIFHDKQVQLAAWPHGVKVSPPPMLDTSKYVAWKKEFNFWRELYGFLPDEYLLSVMGAGTATNIRQMIMKMFHDTKATPERRNIPLLLTYLDKSYATTSREREMNALERLLEIRREGSETVQAFWLRFESILITLENTSSILSSEMIFMRALKSLQLSHQQKTAVLMMLDCQNKDHDIENLKNVSIRLFGLYRDAVTSRQDSRAFVSGEILEQSGSGRTSEEEYETLIVKRAKPKKKNKPGMESFAIRKTQVQTNMDNGTLYAPKTTKPAQKGIICYRCGKTDHTLRQCPMPFQPKLAFAPARIPEKKTFVAINAAGSEENVSTDNADHIDTSANSEPVESTEAEKLFEQVHITTEQEEQDWIASWLERSDQIMVCDEENTEVFLSELETTTSKVPTLSFIIDSGASSTVCGLKWLNKTADTYGFAVPKTFNLSNKAFRFGNNEKHVSIGSVILSGTVIGTNKMKEKVTEKLSILMDIIVLDVPLLLSKATLKSMHATLDFDTDCMWINHLIQVPLINTPGGHILFDWNPTHCDTNDSKVDKVHVALNTPQSSATMDEDAMEEQNRTTKEKLTISAEQIMKAHVHLGHAEPATLLRIFKLAGKSVTILELEKAIAACKCDRIGGYPQNPVVSKYVPEMSGQCIFMDIFYPDSSASFPALLIVCSFSKYVCARFVTSLKPIMLINVLINQWMCLFGMPQSIICDRGTHFQGPDWSLLCNTYSIRMIMAPTGAHYQVGTVERQVELIKRIYRKVSSNVPEQYNRQTKLSLVCAAKNLTPSSTSQWTPMFLVTGRVDHLTGILNVSAPPNADGSDSNEHSIWKRMMLLNEIRGTVLQMDARIIYDITQRKRLRSHNAMELKHNDSALVWFPTDKRWQSGFRFLFDSGKNSILERGSRLVKIPSHWVRPFIKEQQNECPCVDETNLDDTSQKEKETSDNSIEMDMDLCNQAKPQDTPSGCEPSSSSGLNRDVESKTVPISPKRLPFRRYHLRSAAFDTNVISQNNERSDLFPVHHNDCWLANSWLSMQDSNTQLTENQKEKGRENEVNESKLFDEFGPFDIGRIPPRIFLKIPEARSAIREELEGLLRVDKAGIPIAQLCDVNCWEAKNLEKIHTTLICKVKPQKGFKARICLRGDQQNLTTTAFVSAPTAARDFMRWLVIFLMGDKTRWMGLVDISKAFTQSDYLSAEERLFAWLPTYIGINSCTKWMGHIATDHKCTTYEDNELKLHHGNLFHDQSRRAGLILYRPLYGSRDAPYRWWLKISQALRGSGFVQFHVDCCLFGKYRPILEKEKKFFPVSTTQYLDCILMLHVDDILFVGDKRRCEEVERCLAQFEHSGFTYLSENAPLMFCGVEIRRRNDLTVELSQKDFYEKISPPVCEELIDCRDEFKMTKDAMRRSLKSFVGACIWLYQTRYDIIYEVSRLASAIPDALSDVKAMKLFVKASNVLMKKIVEDHLPLKYFPWTCYERRPPQLFVFDDASFASLRNAGSTESLCVLYGQPVKRNGPVECRGNILLFSAKRIVRVCRSSAHAEGISIANAADMALYLQCTLSELLYGVNDFKFLQASMQPPLISPFRPTPSTEQVKIDMSRPMAVSSSLKKPICVLGNADTPSSIYFFCQDCHYGSSMSVQNLREMYAFHDSPLNGPVVHAILLSDCANVVSSLFQGNPRSDEKCLRIVHAFLKDFLQFMNVSYCSALFNLSDVGTKGSGSNIDIWRRLLRTGTFSIGCMSREECKTISNQIKQGGNRKD